MSRHTLAFVLALGVAATAGCARAPAGAGAGDDDGYGDPVDGSPSSVDGSLPPVDGAVAPGDGGAATGCTLGSSGAAAYIPIETMAPGTACNGCHVLIGKALNISGTVYSTAHEADLCLGVPDLQVEVTDSTGTPHLLAVNAAGNFVAQGLFEWWLSPWTVTVVRGAARRPMVGTVTNGDCNSCHTAAGANGADGRIIAP